MYSVKYCNLCCINRIKECYCYGKAERKQQELLEQQERMRKEAEQKKREADEARLEQMRRQEERRRVSGSNYFRARNIFTVCS